MKKNEITDLVITSGISKERFNEICIDALKLTTFTKFLIGDIVHTAKQNGWTDSKSYHKFVKETGYSIRTLQEFALVSSRIHKDVRMEELSFSHHIEVARLSQGEQESKLLEAKENGWSLSELKSNLKQEPEMHWLAKILNDRWLKTSQECFDKLDEFIAEVDFFQEYTDTGEHDSVGGLDSKYREHMRMKTRFYWFPSKGAEQWWIDAYFEAYKKDDEAEIVRLSNVLVIEEAKRYYLRYAECIERDKFEEKRSELGI